MSTQHLPADTSLLVALNCLPGLAWIAAADGAWLYACPEWTRVTGKASATLQGHGWADVVHPDDHELLQAVWRTAVDAAAEVDSLLRLRDHAGVWQPYRWRARHTVHAGAVLYIGCATPATADERALVDQRTSEQQFRALADSMPQLVWIADAAGRHEYLNRRWCEYTGAAPDSGAGWADHVFEEDRARAVALWEHSLATGEPYEVEYRIDRADGGHRWHLARALAVRDDASCIRRWFGTCTDIEDHKRVEEELDQARARLQVIVANMPVGVFIADADGALVGINEQARTVWGGPPIVDSAAEYARYEGYWPDTGKRLEAHEWAMARALTRGEVVVAETIDIVRFDGTRATILNNAAPFRDATGRITGGVVVVVDVTERKRADAAVRESQAQLDAFFRASPGILNLFDEQLRYLRSDDATPAYFGLGPDDIVGRTVEDLAPEFAATYGQLLQQVLATGEPVLHTEISSPVPSLAGRTAHWRASFFPVPLSGGRRGLGVMGVDITDLRKAEESLRLADQRKNEFLAVLSHELRNPLAPLRNSLYVLDHVAADVAATARARSIIERQVRHLARLIDDLLDVTRISRGKMSLRREPLDLAPVIHGVIEDHRPAFVQAGVELLVHETGGPYFIDGDATRLAQIFANLLGNAVKFTPSGGRTTLTVGPGAAGEVRVQVADTGIGMNAETLEHAFAPFVQAAQTIERSHGGLGLGLALVKGLVEMHGGRVTAASPGPGEGATFTVALPLARNTEVGKAAPSPAAATGGPHHVLIIEDNVDSATSLAAALELRGHRVTITHTGPEGVNAALHDPPEVVICDIGLPGLDGYGVVRRLRATPATHHAYVVALSGYALPEDVGKALDAGFDIHCAKPVSVPRLARLIERAPFTRAAPGDRGPAPT